MLTTIEDVDKAIAAADTDALLGALKSPSSELRARSARALGGLRYEIPQTRLEAVVNELAVTIDDGTAAVRVEALRSLASIGEEAEVEFRRSLIRRMQQSFEDTDDGVRQTAVVSLVRLIEGITSETTATLADESVAGMAVEALLRASDDSSPAVRWDASSALGVAGMYLDDESRRRIVKRLLDLLKDLSPFRPPSLNQKSLEIAPTLIRGRAGWALGRMGPVIPSEIVVEVAERLCALLDDPEAEVRAGALWPLGRLAQRLPSDVQARLRRQIHALHNDSNERVRAQAKRLLEEVFGVTLRMVPKT